MVDAFYYTDAGSLTEYFERVRLPNGAADDALMEDLHYALDRGHKVLSGLSPPYCLYLKTIPPIRGQRGFNPCPLVVIRNAAGSGDPTRIRLLVREKREPAKPVTERVRLHQWPEDEDEPPSKPPPKSKPAKPASKPIPPKSVRKRGRTEYDVWGPMFDHLDTLVKKRRRPFETYTEAAGYGLAFLEPLAEQRRKKGKGTAVPTRQSIAEKISKKRPNLVIG